MISGISITVLLACIASVESNNNPRAVGAAGELSQYQISETVWAQHAKPEEKFVLASSDPGLAGQIAEAHIIWLCKELEGHGQRVTVRSVAAAWKSPAAAFGGRQSVAVREYAARVAALYADALAKQPGDGPQHLAP